MSVSGGASQGVYVVTEEDILSGRFRVQSGPAIRVAGIASETRGIMGGPSTPVYIVSDPSARGVIGGAAIPVSNLTGTRLPVHDLAIPVYVESDDGQFVSPVESPTPFWEDLFAFYQLEEASGARVDEISARNLAVVSTDPGQAGGKFGNATLFDGSGYLRSTDVGFQSWDTFSGAYWFYPTSGDFRGHIGVHLDPTFERSWTAYQVSGKIAFFPFRSSDGVGSVVQTVNAFTQNAWNLAAFKWDHVAQTAYVRLNDGAWVSSVKNYAIRQGAYPFFIGTYANDLASPFLGRLDHVGIWKDYLLTDDDYDFMWNAGVGSSWAEIQAHGNAPEPPLADLTAPNDLAAVAISDTEIDLTWTDTALDAEGYKIERAPAGTGTWAEIDDIAAPASGYSDTGLAPVTAYDYRIRAYAGAVNGAYSNTATETTEATPFAGPFDGIAFAALFGMKRFLTAYTGNLIRLRRDSDEAESDFGYVEATGLLDTAAITTWLAGANGFVVTWYDQSGNARDATNATAGAQPAYVASAVNSLPASRYDGTNDVLTLSGSNFYNLLSDKNTYSAMALIAGSYTASAFNDHTQCRGIIGAPSGGGAYWNGLGIGTNSLLSGYFDGAHRTVNHSITIPTNTVVSAVNNNGTLTVRSNGGAGTAGGPFGDINSLATTIGIGRGTTGTSFFNRDMPFVALLASAISAANHNTIGNELADLYGLTWNTVS